MMDFANKKRKQENTCLRYRINIATIVVTIKPITTGKKFRRASSNGSTLHIAAAGISAQGIKSRPRSRLLQFARVLLM